MEWTDEGIVLANLRHGENHTITRLFTEEHGLAAAVVHGGQGTTKRAILQDGNIVQASWRGKGDAMGSFAVELERPVAATAMGSRLALDGLTGVTELLARVLPEGVAYPQLYRGTRALLGHLSDPDLFAVILVKWEVGLLSALGYGLTLDRCAATGASLEDGADLTYVSPRSGSAVSFEAGRPYHDRMLPLPPFLIDRGTPTRPEVQAGLALTGHFIEERLLAPANRALPDARTRFAARIGKVGG